MRGMFHLLSAMIAVLLATSALAQPSVLAQDTTPCGKVEIAPVSVPDDFTLIFRSGPTHADWGTTTTTMVKASGLVTLTERGKRRGSPREEKSTNQQISKQAIGRLYATVMACGFFELDKSYWNRSVMDGWVESLQVTAGGKTHNVVVHHYPVSRFQMVISALNKALAK
jgi:hypothetical protein